MSSPNLEDTVEKESKKLFAVDTGANVSYSLIVGGVIDLLYIGLDVTETLASRATAAVINFFVGRPYGIYRDFLFRKTHTTDKSPKMRVYAVDYIAQSTFHGPLYSLIIATGTYVSKGEIDPEKCKDALDFVIMSGPLIGTTYGAWNDFLRKRFNLPTAAEQAGSQTLNS